MSVVKDIVSIRYKQIESPARYVTVDNPVLSVSSVAIKQYRDAL